MWETVKLSDICKIQPQKKEVKSKLDKDADVTFMGMDLLGINKMYAESSQVRNLDAVYKSYTYFADNDVLLAKITPCFENGKLGIARELVNGVGFGSSEFIVFRCKNSLLPKYLYYFLNQNSFREEGKRNMSGAVGHKRVTKEFIANTLLLLPPLKEQQRIVAKLDAAFAEIDKAIDAVEKNAAQALNVFNQFLAFVDGAKTKLDEIVSIKTGKLDSNAAIEGGKYPFFTCSREVFAINSFAFDCDAVLLAGNNASGDFNVKHYDGKFNAYQRTYVITVKDNNNLQSRYLYFQLINALAAFKRMSVGAGTKFLKLGMIKNLEIPLPDIDAQIEILNYLEVLTTQTEILNTTYRKKNSELKLLKAALLAQELQKEAA